MSNEMDIPQEFDIPVVSNLAGKGEKRGKDELMKERKQKVLNVIEAGEEDLETHFVENPFIKMREKALLKNQKNMSEQQLKGNMEDEDIILIKESGKFVIKDTEEKKRHDQSANQLKRLREKAF